MTAPRVLMLLGQSPAQEAQFHNKPEHWACLAAHLRAAECASRVTTDDLSLLTPAFLSGFDVIVNATTALDPTPSQVEALMARVHAGAGFVGVHAATATFVRFPNYRPTSGRLARPRGGRRSPDGIREVAWRRPRCVSRVGARRAVSRPTSIQGDVHALDCLGSRQSLGEVTSSHFGTCINEVSSHE